MLTPGRTVCSPLVVQYAYPWSYRYCPVCSPLVVQVGYQQGMLLVHIAGVIHLLMDGVPGKLVKLLRCFRLSELSVHPTNFREIHCFVCSCKYTKTKHKYIKLYYLLDIDKLLERKKFTTEHQVNTFFFSTIYIVYTI
jgi:hypothetical protein